MNQLILFLFLLLYPLLFMQFIIVSLRVTKVLFVYAFSYLMCSSFWGNWYLSLINILDSWQIFGGSKIPVPSKPWDFLALCIVHLGIFDGSIIIPAQLFDPNFPVVELPQESIDVIIKCSNLVLRPCSVLDLFYLLDDIAANLFPPLLAFVKIADVTNMPDSPGPIIILFVNQGPFHGPPPIQHTLCLFAITCHLKEITLILQCDQYSKSMLMLNGLDLHILLIRIKAITQKKYQEDSLNEQSQSLKLLQNFNLSVKQLLHIRLTQFNFSLYFWLI